MSNPQSVATPSTANSGPAAPLESSSDSMPSKVVVLLVDDQLIIGEAVRRILAAHPDIEYHFCQKPEDALTKAMTVTPTVILQDLVMPGVDGLDLVRDFRANEGTRLTPLIVLSSKEEGVTKAEAFARGANDYVVKLPDPLELVARIRYHSRGYMALLERNAAFAALHQKQQELAAELGKAASYVRSLLPAPWSGEAAAEREQTEASPAHGIAVDWRFVPSASLGGDTFDYFWIDPDHLALYLLDVCGHGVGPALLSVSVMNVLRSQRNSGVDRRDPAAVLADLNGAFRMSEQGGMFFTIWYGVFQRSTRTLTFSGGGHPPSLLLVPDQASPAGGVRIEQLESPGLPIGVASGIPFENLNVQVPEGASLMLYSDGAVEVFVAEGEIWGVDGLVEFMAAPAHRPDAAPLDPLLARVREIAGGDVLPDDLSVVLAKL